MNDGGDSDQGYISLIMNWIENNSTSSFDFTQPYLKRSLRYVYPLFMFLHAAVGLIGFIGNVTIIIIIGKRRLYRDQMFFFIGNLAFSDIIKCVIVLPISLANMMIQNWVFGSFLCFFLPMIQLFPIHASMLTFLMIAIDRYRVIVYPFKVRVPAGLCIIAVWVGAVCIVLPHAVYIKYIDLGAFLGHKFDGTGICYVNIDKHIEEYLRAMFVTLYAMPLAIIGFLFVKISVELKARDTAPMVVRYSLATSKAASSSTLNGTCSTKITPNTENDRGVEAESASCSRVTERSEQVNQTYTPTTVPANDDDLNLEKEKRTQNYLTAMITFFAMCWCPMNILIMVHYFVHETDNNRGHIDITFILFSWFGFLSTCVNPILFASWCMSNSTKEKLKGYFKFNNNRRRSSSQMSRTEVTESILCSAASPSPNPVRKMSNRCLATPSPNPNRNSSTTSQNSKRNSTTSSSNPRRSSPFPSPNPSRKTSTIYSFTSSPNPKRRSPSPSPNPSRNTSTKSSVTPSPNPKRRSPSPSPNQNRKVSRTSRTTKRNELMPNDIIDV